MTLNDLIFETELNRRLVIQDLNFDGVDQINRQTRRRVRRFFDLRAALKHGNFDELRGTGCRPGAIFRAIGNDRIVEIREITETGIRARVMPDDYDVDPYDIWIAFPAFIRDFKPWEDDPK